MSYQYGVPPTHYQKFYDSSSPHSSGEYVHYEPRGYNYSTPMKGHGRKASHQESPRAGGWYAPAGSPPPPYPDAYGFYHTPQKDIHVSYDRRPPPAYGMPANTRTPRKPSQPIHIFGDDGVEYAEPLPRYVHYEPSPLPKSRTNKHGKKFSTDSYFYYNQGQVYEEQPKRSRARASSNTAKTTPKHKSSSSRTIPQATEKDAIRAGIPAGYSYKNWDPTEKPIILLGSVFDANSLGKWIYDWTVFHHGASTPMADMAGDLWLLLIKLAGKMKRAEECVKRVRNIDSREMIEDFIASGARLWNKFKSLLKDCEYFMMKAAKREGSKTMGKNAGTEFVDSIFGRERYLESTEKIMTNVRLWNMRFDVNCEDILRRPTVA